MSRADYAAELRAEIARLRQVEIAARGPRVDASACKDFNVAVAERRELEERLSELMEAER